jgi:hypothetical protein
VPEKHRQLTPLRAQHALVSDGGAPHLRPNTAQPAARKSAAVAPLSFEGPVGVVRCVSPVELDSIVDRLYRKGLEERRRHHESAASDRSPSPSAAQRPQSPHVASHLPPRPVSAAPTLTTDEMKESVNRLYYNGMKHKLDEHRRLAGKYLFQRPKKLQEGVSSKELRDRVVQRFYVDEASRHQRVQDDLLKAYVEPTQPNVAHRSRDEITVIVDRLYSGSK